MSNPETPKTASDLVVSASACVVVACIAAALAEHTYWWEPERDHAGCRGCDWVSHARRPDLDHAAHQASAVTALPDVAIVPTRAVKSNLLNVLYAEDRQADCPGCGHWVGGHDPRGCRTLSCHCEEVWSRAAARAAGGVL